MTEESENQLQYLFRKFLDNEITKEEYDQLWELLNIDPEDTHSKDLVEAELQKLWESAKEGDPVMKREEWDHKMGELLRVTSVTEDRTMDWGISRRKSYRWVAAAVIGILLVAGGAYFYQPEEVSETTIAGGKKTEKGILPGGNKAVLTLANGSKITLDSAANGTIYDKAALMVGYGYYRFGDPSAPAAFQSPAELERQFNLTKRDKEVQGDLFYSAKYIPLNKIGITDKLASFYQNPAVIPPFGRAVAPGPAKPTNVRIENSRLKWEVAGNERSVVYYFSEAGKEGVVKTITEDHSFPVDASGFYCVTTLNTDNRESDPSEIVEK